MPSDERCQPSNTLSANSAQTIGHFAEKKLQKKNCQKFLRFRQNAFRRKFLRKITTMPRTHCQKGFRQTFLGNITATFGPFCQETFCQKILRRITETPKQMLCGSSTYSHLSRFIQEQTPNLSVSTDFR